MNSRDDNAYATVRIALDHAYEVRIGAGLLARLGEFVRERIGPRPRRAVVVIDSGLPGAAAVGAIHSLTRAGFEAAGVMVTPSEEGKSLAGLERVLAAIAEHRLERAEPVVAVGGGIVGDLAGFAAAVYRRGVPVFQCPTTLLAMVDASVGGKTGVNLALRSGELAKNFVGAFHQPEMVVADTATLASLSPREFRCGLAECVKHGLLSADAGDPDLEAWTRSNADAVASRDGEAVARLVERNVRVKAAIVGADEHERNESGGRALLNLGHTFGHAIETLPTLSPGDDPALAPLKHGEAVSLGLVAACECGRRLGATPPELAEGVRRILEQFGLPVAVRGLPPGPEVLRRMGHDKKVRDGRLRLIIPVGGGRTRIFADAPEAAILAAIDAIRL